MFGSTLPGQGGAVRSDWRWTRNLVRPNAPLAAVRMVRLQEVLQAVQALGQAYADYDGALAHLNRAQFRLYWAIGSPAPGVKSPERAEPHRRPC
jgi:hypothetical protein